MSKRVSLLIVCLLATLCFGCKKMRGLTEPEDLPTTPSAQTGLISVTLSVATPGQTMNVVLAEDLNRGLATPYLNDGAPDYLGMLVQVVDYSSCHPNGFVLSSVEWPNGTNPSTGKNEVHFNRIDSCSGKPRFAIRVDRGKYDPGKNAFVHVGPYQEMTFPDMNRVIKNLPRGFDIQKASDHVVITGGTL